MKSKVFKKKDLLSPSRVLAIGFLGVILIGSLILNLPIASQNRESVGFINALFTAASATCVTGLVVVNTAQHWSSFGKFVILALIQIGGLGFMTMATLTAIFLGKKISLKDRLVIKEQVGEESMTGLVRLIQYIVVATFTIEAIGAVILSIKFIPALGLKKGIFYSIFHAISGFCNAGFDIMGDSLSPYVGDLLLNLTISSLVILGGIGFSVYIDIGRKRNFKGLKLHSKLVIVMTIILLLVGSIGVFVLEYSNPDTLQNLSLKDKALSSYFQSAVARTAGFYSLDLSKLRESTIFLLIILMFIGGSPASTAGGIKTTTFGVLLLGTRAQIRGDKDVIAFKKRIPQEVVNRALAIVTISLIIVALVSFLLTVTEEADFIDILYEVTSAFATVGVSRNLSPKLTNIGKIIISFTMYLGRVGPLTMAVAFQSKDSKRNFRYSEGNVLVG